MVKKGVALLGAMALVGTFATGAFANELKNAKGDQRKRLLNLHFPPSAIKTFKKGDEVSVDLALKKAKSSEAAAHSESKM
jgi:hypothetical protein